MILETERDGIVINQRQIGLKQADSYANRRAPTKAKLNGVRRREPNSSHRLRCRFDSLACDASWAYGIAY